MTAVPTANDDVRRLPLSDGGRLAYRERGDGLPLLLVHGWGVSGRAFEPTLATLSSAHRVIVPDLRGHGLSSPFESRHGFARLADDLGELAAALELRAVTIVGWSMGAMIAWDLATRRQPAWLAGLVTVDMVPCLLSTDGWPHGLRRGDGPAVFERTVAAMRADWSAFCHIFVPRIFAEPPEPADSRSELLYAAAAANDGEVMAQVWLAMAGQDLRDRITHLTGPALHLYGERSRLYRPAAARWLRQAVPGLALKSFPTAGHAPHLEAPDRFDEAVAEFIREVAGEAARDSRLAGNRRTTN